MPWLYSVVYNSNTENHDLGSLNRIDLSALQELEWEVCFSSKIIKKIAELLVTSKEI